MDSTLLAGMLTVAVMGEIANVTEASMETFLADRDAMVDLIAAHSDDLMYGGRHCAKTFGVLAYALAHLAYNPGGIEFAGLHWCTGSVHQGTNDETPCAAEQARERSA